MSVENGWDVCLKCIVVGNSGVGKTSLVERFCRNTYKPTIETTIGVDFTVKELRVDDKRVKIICWDTAGNEKFRSLSGAYYRGAQLAILVYDVSSYATFTGLQGWLDELEIYTDNKDVTRVLIGNKSDISTDCREVQESTGVALASKHDMLFSEASAKSGDRVASLITAAVKKTINTPSLMQTAVRASSLVLNVERGGIPARSSGGCC